MAKLPWDYIDGVEQPTPGFAPAPVTPETIECGEHLARFFDAEFAKSGRDTRCETCAFRQGTHANTSLNVANALKCAVEGKPFWCHETERPCGGWVGLQRAKAETPGGEG